MHSHSHSHSHLQVQCVKAAAVANVDRILFEKDLFTFLNSFWQTFLCNYFEIASRAPADGGQRTRRTAGNHLNGIRSNDDQPKIKHHYRDRSRVCLFVCGSRCCASSLAMGACQMLFRGGAYGNKVCVNVKNLTTIAEDRRTTDRQTDNGRTDSWP